MSSLNQSQTPIHIDYRNGTYYGQLTPDYKRTGKGMLILDTSTVLFAEWKNNLIDSFYIYLTDGIHAFGTMTAGKLDGYNIIESIGSSFLNNGQYIQQNSANKTFYGTFRNEKLYGRVVIV